MDDEWDDKGIRRVQEVIDAHERLKQRLDVAFGVFILILFSAIMFIALMWVT